MLRLELPRGEIAILCEKWHITELAVFGSAVRDDFRPDSDVDLLVTFAPDARISLFGLVDLTEEFERVIGREVDLVEKRAIKNPYRRKSILANYEVVYASCRS